MTAFVSVRAQAGHVCESCSRIFDTARGLMAHRTQIHSLKPKQPVKWTHKDGEGLTRTFVVHAEESNDMTKGALYQCPRDQTHTSHSTRGFKRHLRSCYGEFELLFEAKPRAQARPSGSGVSRQNETSLPPTPDSDDDYEEAGSDFAPTPKRRRGRPPTRGRPPARTRRSAKKQRIIASPDSEETAEATQIATGSLSAAGRTGPVQGPAAEAQGTGPGQQSTFLEDFLSRLSQQTDEDFTRHADVFREFGMLERHQFQRAQEKPALMAKISKKLEDRKVSVWAVSNIEAFLDEYFAEDPQKDSHA